MANLKNSVKLIGRLGKDPEVKTFENGRMKTSFSLATTDHMKIKRGKKFRTPKAQPCTMGKYRRRGWSTFEKR